MARGRNLALHLGFGCQFFLKSGLVITQFVFYFNQLSKSVTIHHQELLRKTGPYFFVPGGLSPLSSYSGSSGLGMKFFHATFVRSNLCDASYTANQ